MVKHSTGHSGCCQAQQMCWVARRSPSLDGVFPDDGGHVDSTSVIRSCVLCDGLLRVSLSSADDSCFCASAPMKGRATEDGLPA
jgi:hypothetical protein